MTQGEVLTVVTDAMVVGTRVAAPILISALVVGVLVSLFQAVTQVQEMTLTFVPKLVVAGVILLVAGGWMLDELTTWVTALWGSMGAAP